MLLTGCGIQNSLAQSSAQSARTSCATPRAMIQHTSAQTHTPVIVFLDPEKYPRALCNDGTPAAYILRHGSGSAASRWVISLQGGGKCFDQKDCSTRGATNQRLISSAPYRGEPTSDIALDGIQSSDPAVNPDFYDATQVEAFYCSSDDWSGSKVGSGPFNIDNIQSWSFQGHAILAAILDDLKTSRGLAHATEVLFTGESAGGYGVFVNANAVQDLVPSRARFVAFSDAGFLNNVENYDADGPPPHYTSAAAPNEHVERAQGIHLWHGYGDPVCARRASTIDEQLGCYSGEHLLAPGGTLTLPMLVADPQQDSGQLEIDGVPKVALETRDFTPEEGGYIRYFAGAMRDALLRTRPGVSVFSPDVLLHEQASSDKLFNTAYSFPTGTVTLQQVVSSWYQDPCQAQRDIAP